MDDANTPAFEMWTRKELDEFAYTVHARVIELVMQNLQLRIDLKRANQELNNYKDDWK